MLDLYNKYLCGLAGFMAVRRSKKYPFSPSDLPKLLSWAAGHEYFSFFNGNGYPALHGAFANLLFVGRKEFIESNENSFGKLDGLLKSPKDWLYGFLSYDLKNEIEDLKSENPSTIPIAHLGFYVPEIVLKIHENQVEIESFDDPDIYYEQIALQERHTSIPHRSVGSLTCSTSKQEYVGNVQKIKSAIVEGEFCEMNYCIEFVAEVMGFDPLSSYQKLNAISPMPFSSFMRFDKTHLICASPERFLKKEGNKIISQPIKGTSRRSHDQEEDERLKRALRQSEKEKAENLMIVDLVRNDLAKSAQTGSVQVEELFGVYTFEKVHQMISTVSAQCKENMGLTDIDIIKNAFPMGSMTGAPKIRVMQEIESLENSARGLYSGAVGYFTPNLDFDFNVVIRSIIYNAATNMVSFHVGSAITYDSDPEHEYQECLLKAESLMEVLS